jgi:predicted PurR-regulated permease PerM
MSRDNNERVARFPHSLHNSNGAVADSFTRRTLKAVGIVSAVVIGVLLLWSAVDVFLLIFAAILIAVFLYSLSSLICEHTPLPYRWSLATVILMIVGLSGLVTWLWAPRIISEATQLIDTLPQTVAQLRQRLGAYAWGQELLARIPTVNQIVSGRAGMLPRITTIFSTVIGTLTAVVFVLFAGLYLAVDPHLYEKGIVRLVPVSKRDHARHILHVLGYTLRWWLIGRLSSMLIIGVLTTVGLWLLGMPLALILGVLAGLLEYIPNFGPILAAVPALLIALTQGSPHVLYVLLLYVAVQSIESYLLTPLILKHAVSLPPVLTLSVVVLFGVLFGFLGLLLATPLAAVLLVLVQILYVRDTLGDDSVEVIGERHEQAADAQH